MWLGVVAAVLFAGGSAGAAEGPKVRAAPEAEAPLPGEPIEPILVQGFVKSVSDQQLTLTAPGAPVDLPLSLVEETRYIQGEDDVKHEAVHEGQLVRAALLPMGEDLVALVVEVVPEAEKAPAEPAPDDGLQGETPPDQPGRIAPGAPEPEAVPLEPAHKGKTTEL